MSRLIKPSRRLFLAGSAALIASPGIVRAQSPLRAFPPGTFQSRAPLDAAAALTYTGLGDIVSPWTAYWGLRAFSNATTGGSLADVDGDLTVTVFTFVSKSDGTIDLVGGGAAAFIAANTSNLRVKKLYDQTGNGHHLIGSGAARPFLTPVGPSTFPVITFSSSQILTATGFAVAQPFSIAGVARETSSAGIASLLSDSTNVEFSFNTTPALRVKTSGNLPSGTTSINTFYSVQGVYNGASSVVTVNGTDTTGTIGGNGITAAHSLQVGNDDFSEALPGSINELGILPSASSSGNRTSISANQRAFWPF